MELHCLQSKKKKKTSQYSVKKTKQQNETARTISKEDCSITCVKHNIDLGSHNETSKHG